MDSEKAIIRRIERKKKYAEQISNSSQTTLDKLLAILGNSFITKFHLKK